MTDTPTFPSTPRPVLLPGGEGTPSGLRAGPALAWVGLCGAMRGARAGGAVHVGCAPDLAGRVRLAARGELALEPAQHLGAVGPMAVVMTPALPVWVVRNEAHGNLAYS